MNAKPLILFSILSLSVSAHANPLEKLSRGCMNEGYSFKYKLLNLHPSQAGKSDSVYFIYNDSRQPVYLFQARNKDTFQGNELNNQVNPGQFSVYSANEKLVKFICTTPNSNYLYGKIVDCKKILKVCEYSDVKFGMNNRGNYWMVRSGTRNTALRQANRHGVILSYGHY